MLNPIILKNIKRRVAALINAAETDVEHSNFWIRHLLETGKRNSKPNISSGIPTFLNTTYSRTYINTLSGDTKEFTCVQPLDDDRAAVLFSPQLYDYIASTLNLEGPSEFLFSETKVDGEIAYFLEVPGYYLRKMNLSIFVLNAEEVIQSLSELSKLERVSLQVNPDRVSLVKQQFCLELKNVSLQKSVNGSLPAIIVPKLAVDRTLTWLGFFGAFPSKDEEHELLIKKGLTLSDGNLKVLAQRTVPLEFLPEPGEETIQPEYIPSELDIKTILSEKLHSMDLEASSIEQRSFYYLLIRRLMVSIEDFPIGSCCRMLDEQRQLASARIFDLLSAMESLDYNEFLIAVRFCLDDIMLLMSLRLPTSSEDFHQEFDRQIRETLLNFVSDNYIGETPTGISLTNSGMQACHMAMSHAIQLIVSMRADARILISSKAYYEISLPNYKLLSPSEDRLPWKLDSKGNATKYDGKLLDIWMGNFEANVSHEKSSPQYTDVNQIIEEQLHLRRESDSEESPFVVILDNTMSSYDDVAVSLMLTTYQEPISTGQLIIICSHSLNKFFHMGQDNTPAGIIYSFYALEKYSRLANMHQSLTGGFSLVSPTVLYILSIMKHGSDLVNLYQSRLRGRSRYIHETLIPDTLMYDQHAIVIYKPKPIVSLPHSFLEERSTIDFGNYSTFINICVRKGCIVHPYHEEAIKREIKSVLEKNRVCSRMGFGFAETTYDCFSEDNVVIFRISIGTEELAFFENLMTNLVELIQKLNKKLRAAKITSLVDERFGTEELSVSREGCRELGFFAQSEEPPKALSGAGAAFDYSPT